MSSISMETPKTKIFVGHLPDGCTSEDLQPLFEKYGSVTECDVINKYGFVHMNTPEEADAAIQNLNNYNLMGSLISVEHSKSKLHPNPGAPGRAKGALPGARRGGMPPRNGFGPVSRDVYGLDVTNGYRRYDAPMYGGPIGDPYYDRPFGYGRENRMRPYPILYERTSPSMPIPREDYTRRPMPLQPPPVPVSDPYAHSLQMAVQEDLYERRPMAERTDYLYSRRSPSVATMPQRSYWYEDTTHADFSSRAPPPPPPPPLPPQGATRRPAFY